MAVKNNAIDVLTSDAIPLNQVAELDAERNQWYGWKPDLPDFRDLRFSLAHARATDLVLPSRFALEPPDVYDQGQLGSCTANGSVMAYRMMLAKKTGAAPPDFSRLFQYYITRAIEHTTSEDSGAYIRDAIKALAHRGATPESEWPYDIAKFTRRPPHSAYTSAKKHQVYKYERVDQNPVALKTAIMTKGPVVFGFTVYESFESLATERTGVVQFPSASEEAVGGHCMILIGWDDARGGYLALNSWGSDWGLAGRCYMPYSYIHNPNLADDFWVMSRIEG